MTNSIDEIPDELHEIILALASNLSQCEPILRLKQANHNLEVDPKASQMKSEFSLLQKKVRAQQYTADYSESDVIKLRSLQTLYYANLTLKEQAAAYEDAINMLRDLNHYMSSLLKMDFAALTRRYSDD